MDAFAIRRIRLRKVAELAADQISYEDLYTRWEKGNWRAMEHDFAGTGRTGPSSPTSSAGALWNFSLFFRGEDAVADNLSPYIDAAPREEQKYFLATQQVDEARHACSSSASCTRSPASARRHRLGPRRRAPELTWGF